MITVPVFTAITQCPAWSGMMLVLGLLGLITSLLHGPEDEKYSLKGALTRVEVPDALFFLGVLFAVGGLERVGLLKDQDFSREFAVQLSTYVPYDALVAIFLGFASAIVDNVPLVAAAQGMYDLEAHPANDGLWNLITYCAATGGSLLVIGSAAGVAFMGMERKVCEEHWTCCTCGLFLGCCWRSGAAGLGTERGSARDGLQVDRLEVCWMCSGDLACMVDAAPNMSITDVRSQVLERTGVPVEQQRLFCEGSELLHQADFMHVGICGKPTIQLVRCNSDPRNTNRAYFRENLKLPEGPVGNFCHVKKIGAAIYGEVGMYRWAQPNDNSDVVDVAVKCISVQKARQTLEKDHQLSPLPRDAYAEIGVLQYLSKQPDLPEYLLKLLAAFIDDSKIWLVMEMADGGELLDAVLSQKVTHGPQTKQYLWQTLKAVQYLHAHCIGGIPEHV
eukprot:g23693.t1